MKKDGNILSVYGPSEITLIYHVHPSENHKSSFLQNNSNPKRIGSPRWQPSTDEKILLGRIMSCSDNEKRCCNRRSRELGAQRREIGFSQKCRSLYLRTTMIYCPVIRLCPVVSVVQGMLKFCSCTTILVTQVLEIKPSLWENGTAVLDALLTNIGTLTVRTSPVRLKVLSIPSGTIGYI